MCIFARVHTKYQIKQYARKRKKIIKKQNLRKIEMNKEEKAYNMIYMFVSTSFRA